MTDCRCDGADVPCLSPPPETSVFKTCQTPSKPSKAATICDNVTLSRSSSRCLPLNTRRRPSETSEQAAARRQRDRERKRQLRLQESSLETALRRHKDALNKMKQRLAESPEQTARRRAKDRERARRARRSESSEQAAHRREKNRLRKRELRRKESLGDSLETLLTVGLDVCLAEVSGIKKENASPT